MKGGLDSSFRLLLAERIGRLRFMIVLKNKRLKVEDRGHTGYANAGSTRGPDGEIASLGELAHCSPRATEMDIHSIQKKTSSNWWFKMP